MAYWYRNCIFLRGYVTRDHEPFPHGSGDSICAQCTYGVSATTLETGSYVGSSGNSFRCGVHQTIHGSRYFTYGPRYTTN